MEKASPQPESDTQIERHALLALALTYGLGPRLISRLTERFGSACLAVESVGKMWSQVAGISQQGAIRFKEALHKTLADQRVEQEVLLCEKHGVTLIGQHERGYPPLLKTIADAPPLLWVRGKLVPQDALAVAIVGSRKCTTYGREQAEQIAYGLAQAGVTVVSGGAYGIDIAAHRGALNAVSLDAGQVGRTVAVIGSGLAKPYPQDHVNVFSQIVEHEGRHGAVVSEFPMMTPPNPENFLRRNRVISGLSVGVLVIEAARRSGALNTARRCVDEHGRDLMALPGRVDSPASFGCHQIIKEQWGRMVTGVADVLEIVSESGTLLEAAGEIAAGVNASAKTCARVKAIDTKTLAAVEQSSEPVEPALPTGLSESETAILTTLDQSRLLDEVIADTGLPIEKVQAELTMLEIRGVVQREAGRFVRRRSR